MSSLVDRWYCMQYARKIAGLPAQAPRVANAMQTMLTMFSNVLSISLFVEYLEF